MALPLHLSSPLSFLSTPSSSRRSLPLSLPNPRHRILTARSSSSPKLPNPPNPPNPNPNFLDLARTSLSLLVFSASLSFSFLKPPISTAITTPSLTETQPKTTHEYSPQTRQLLASVSALLATIDQTKSGNSTIKEVKASLSAIKAKRKHLKSQVLEKLDSDTREWRREKMDLIRKSGDVMDAGVEAKREKDRTGKMKGGGDKAKIERLECVIKEAEREYNEIWERIGEIEDRILRKENLAYNVAIRELLFIESECERLVDKVSREMRYGGGIR